MLLRKPLEKNKVEAGKVFIQPIYNGDLVTVSLLTVYPHSKIAERPQRKGFEWYLNILTGESHFCDIGAAHEYVNETDQIQRLLFVQIKKEMDESNPDDSTKN